MIHQEHPLILFDGLCGFCNRSVRFIVRRDPRGVFQFASQHSQVGRKILTARGLPEEPGTMVVLDRHHVHLRSNGIVFILRNLKAPWPVAGFFLSFLPKIMRDNGYNWIARNRYRLFGRLETCPIWPPAIRARVID